MPRILNERPSDAPALPSVDARIFRLMLPFLWPRDDLGLRVRLVLSMALLCLTAILNAVVPILFAHAVDRISAPGQAAIAVPVALLDQLFRLTGVSDLTEVIDHIRTMEQAGE